MIWSIVFTLCGESFIDIVDLLKHYFSDAAVHAENFVLHDGGNREPVKSLVDSGKDPDASRAESSQAIVLKPVHFVHL